MRPLCPGEDAQCVVGLRGEFESRARGHDNLFVVFSSRYQHLSGLLLLVI